MTDIYPKGRVITVEAEIILPESATDQQIDAWVSFAVFQEGSIDNENPLSAHGANAEGILWRDTGDYRETTYTDVRKAPDGGISLRVSRVNKRDLRTPDEVSAWVSPDQARANAARKALGETE